MSDQSENNESAKLAELKKKCDELSITYHPSIGYDKLQEKVNAAMPLKDEVKENIPVQVDTAVETENMKRKRLRKEASALHRVIITCMNPAKTEWQGELFTCGNSYIGSFTNYIPFSVDAGWHVPSIILKQIENRKCQTFITDTDSRGNKSRKGKLIKEFSITHLPTLTEDQIKELAQRQAMSGSISS